MMATELAENAQGTLREYQDARPYSHLRINEDGLFLHVRAAGVVEKTPYISPPSGQRVRRLGLGLG